MGGAGSFSSFFPLLNDSEIFILSDSLPSEDFFPLLKSNDHISNPASQLKFMFVSAARVRLDSISPTTGMSRRSKRREINYWIFGRLFPTF